MQLPDEAAQELFRASSAEGAPQLRALTIRRRATTSLTPAAARMLALAGWPLEALDLRGNWELGAAGVAALVAAPSLALRRLDLPYCVPNAAALLSVANAPWPLKELNLMGNRYAAAAGPALAALSQHVGMRRLDASSCDLSAASFKALVEAAWPALTSLSACFASVAFDGPHALGAAAFAGLPALEELSLSHVPLGEAGARLLASWRWARLKELNLDHCWIGDAGIAALARGAWPALAALGLNGDGLSAPPTLEDVRRWAPALAELLQ